MRRVAPAIAAGVALAVWGFVSRWLPALPVKLDILASSGFVLTLAAIVVWGMLPLSAWGRRLPLLTLAAVLVAVLMMWLDLVPLANIAKIVAGASLGIWIADELEHLSWIVVVAAVSALVDVFSVAAGPTRAILEKGPVVVGWFIVAITWSGYSYSEAYTGLGVSDIVFFALYLGSARRFDLRVGWSAVAMVASFVATIAFAMWWTALPALPLLSVAFLAVNGDVIWRRLHAGRGRPSLGD